MTESNLSATTFALNALKAAGVPADDPAFAKALTFVKRCQNWPEKEEERDPKFDDGGFFFIYDDPIRNKAGVAGKRHRLLHHSAKYIRQNRGTKVMSASDTRIIKTYIPNGLP